MNIRDMFIYQRAPNRGFTIFGEKMRPPGQVMGLATPSEQ
jgi:hypothetical protein